MFRAEGAAVGLIDIAEAELAGAVGEIGASDGPPAVSAACDVADARSVGEAVASIAERIGRVDGVVNAAGIDHTASFAETTVDDWRRVIDINLTGPFNLTKAALDHFGPSGGTIVHIASGAALRPLADRTAYCSSKAGLVMFAKSLAVDLAPDGIRVNAICPGVVNTPMFRGAIDASADPDAELAKILDRYLIKNVARPDDIANAALFLTSDESGHVTGSTLAVDGGRTFH